MKNIRKITLLSALVLGGMALFTGCREDETVDLEGYPETPVGITIAGLPTDATVVEMTGIYAGDGSLVTDGELARTYDFVLTQPSPEDVTLYVEPLFVNIPEEKVVISETVLSIPAGNTTASVAVSLVDDDMDFIVSDTEAKTYELGVRITDVEGYKTALTEPEGKVILKKEAYTVGVSVSGTTGREVSFTRSYADGKILDEEPMTYTFKVSMNRPAKADVKVTFTTGGLDAEFVDDVLLTPSEVTIPAGEQESEEIAWTLSDDFLLTTDEPETHTVTLTANIQSDDGTVVPLDGETVITFNIEKIYNILSLVTGVDSSWLLYDRSEWSATGENGEDDPENVLDGRTYTYYYTRGQAFAITIDMKKAYEMHGMAIRYYYNSPAYAATKFFILTSDDGQTWTSRGMIEKLQTAHYVKFMAPVTARYVKFDAYQQGGSMMAVANIEVYGLK